MIWVPESHENCTLENFDWKTKEMLQSEVNSLLKEEREKGLLLIGKPGVGKTHLIVGVFKELERKGYLLGSEVIFTEWDILVQSVRRMMYDYRMIPEESVDNILTARIILLDDVKAPQGKVALSVLKRVIENYYNHNKIGMISANAMDTSQLIERWELPDYWSSRLFSRFDIVNVKGKDRRID